MSSPSRPSLDPISKPAPEREPFAVFDIEGSRWTRFLMVGYFDGSKFLHFESVKEFLCYLERTTTPSTLFAHFGGIYDFLFILEGILANPRWKLGECIPRGSGMLSFQAVSGVGTSRERLITFRDSSALLPFSLKKLTHSFAVEHPKQDMDVTRIRKVTPRLIRYNEYDCRGLHEVLTKFYSSDLLSGVPARPTLASQAIQVFRRYLDEPIPSCPDAFDSFVRRGYAGGRTEIFRPLHPGPEPIHCYDFNSLYPAIMRDCDMPGGVAGWSRKLELDRIGFVECEVEVPPCYVPILWVKEIDQADGKKLRKFVFPVGRFKGVFPTCELKAAITHQGARVIRMRRALYFKNAGRVFAPYISDLYRIRQETKDPVKNLIAKLLMNSTYGRMGIRRDRERLELDAMQKGAIPLAEFQVGEKEMRMVKVPAEIRGFSNVAIAAWVTAQARLRLWRALEHHRTQIFYCDTDSIFTTARLPNSEKLGELKFEYSADRACFLLPKTYVAGEKIAMKGFDKRKIARFTYEDFKSALEGELRLLKIRVTPGLSRLRTALLHGKIIHRLNEEKRERRVRKRIRSLYEKRRIFLDASGKWETEPLMLGATSVKIGVENVATEKAAHASHRKYQRVRLWDPRGDQENRDSQLPG